LRNVDFAGIGGGQVVVSHVPGNAHNLIRLFMHEQPLAQGIRRAPIAAQQSFIDDCHARRVRPVVGPGESTALQHGDSHHPEIAAAHRPVIRVAGLPGHGRNAIDIERRAGSRTAEG
jgi:hypothetical protein